LQRETAGWKSELESGATPADLVSQSSYFPDIFASLYSTAEQSGQLDEALGRLHTYFRDGGIRKLRTFTRLVTWIIYGLIVVLVGYKVIQYYVGYYSGLINSY
jgi:type II secretory pathway component PulF